MPQIADDAATICRVLTRGFAIIACVIALSFAASAQPRTSVVGTRKVIIDNCGQMPQLEKATTGDEHQSMP